MRGGGLQIPKRVVPAIRTGPCAQRYLHAGLPCRPGHGNAIIEMDLVLPGHNEAWRQAGERAETR